MKKKIGVIGASLAGAMMSSMTESVEDKYKETEDEAMKLIKQIQKDASLRSHEDTLHLTRKEQKANIVPVEPRNKTGRNDPCMCGSGKKYKKCCG